MNTNLSINLDIKAMMCTRCMLEYGGGSSRLLKAFILVVCVVHNKGKKDFLPQWLPFQHLKWGFVDSVQATG